MCDDLVSSEMVWSIWQIGSGSDFIAARSHNAEIDQVSRISPYGLTAQ